MKTLTLKPRKIIVIGLALSMFMFSTFTQAAGTGAGGGTGTETTPDIVAPEPIPEKALAEELLAPVPTPEPAPNNITDLTQPTSLEDWTECLEDGYQELVGDPDVRRVCEGLKCGHLETLEERVDCRLDLSNEEVKAEFAILYFPEYCKAEGSDEEKQDCIELYKSFKPCWDLEGQARLDCGMEKTGTDNFAEALTNCKAANAQTECKEELTEKVEHLLLYTMYELEFKAETLLDEGRTSKKEVVDLIVAIEENKVEVEEAEGDTAEWKSIAQDTQSIWNNFVNQVQ